ncbi:MAG: dual specificity protein phosphatase family protein [Tepidisphaeraceae bacterium]|jgi:predicted protein tyrosine phosphatase
MNWKAAGKTSALLCLLFLVVYGGSNWLTGRRHNIGSFYFAWERHIPFVPVMILPYMSIDLFFIAAPFLCRSDRERRTLANRITAAILISAACWLLFPLRFAFERPPVDGWLGVIFNNFRMLDQPFNQLPSLHITLWAILLDLYTRYTRGITRDRAQNSEHSVWTPESRGMGVSPMLSVLRHIFHTRKDDHALVRLALRLWFTLIAISTVLTYQHHVIDVAGGFALAAWCFYLFQDQPLRLPVICNRRVGLYYATAAILMTALAFAALPWSTPLLWPATSLALAATACFGLGPGIFRKRNGRLPLSTWCVLWPLLLGQRLSWLYYARHCRPWDALTPRLWIGRQLTDTEAQHAIAQGITAVLDLTGEFSEARPFLNTGAAIHPSTTFDSTHSVARASSPWCRYTDTSLPSGTMVTPVAIAYHPLPILDLTAPTPAQLDEAIDFIRRESARGIVYVHCKVGYSRTAAVAGAYLLADKIAATAEDAVNLLRVARPTIVVRPEARQALDGYHARRDANSSCTVPGTVARMRDHWHNAEPWA